MRRLTLVLLAIVLITGTLSWAKAINSPDPIWLYAELANCVALIVLATIYKRLSRR